MSILTSRLLWHMLCLLGGSVLLTLLVIPLEKIFWSEADLVVANLLPIWVLLLTVYCLSGRLFSSLVFGTLVFAGLRYLHSQKVEILEAPLELADAKIVSQMAESPDMVFNYLSWPIILGLGLLVAAGSLLLLKERPAFSFVRRLLFLVAIIFLLLVSQGLSRGFYNALPYSPWSPNPSFEKVGIVAFLVQDYLRHKDLRRPAADTKVIENARAQYQLQSLQTSEVQQPDVVIWLSESFFDVGVMNHIESCEHTPYFCALAAQNISGSITVPTYAGQTIRTEFEILTGVPMSAVKEHHFPYMTLTNQPVNSIAWALREQGYQTSAMHNHKRGFWRRPLALTNLGFESWAGLEDLKRKTRRGYYHADSDLTDTVLAMLDSRSDTLAPQLVFAISMQAHGPHGKQPGLPPEELAAIVLPQELAVENDSELRQYLYHLRAADTELERLATYVKQRQRPTLVLFFGDHLPGLSGVYRDLEFDNGQGAKKQQTPFVVFANFPLRAPPQDMTALASWQLATLTLRSGGLLGEGVFAWFGRLYDELSWSTGAQEVCAELACEALLQLQYLQLNGPAQGSE